MPHNKQITFCKLRIGHMKGKAYQIVQTNLSMVGGTKQEIVQDEFRYNYKGLRKALKFDNFDILGVELLHEQGRTLW